MKRLASGVFLCATLTLSGLPQAALAGPEPFIGEIMLTGANFCPRGWADANGQLLAVAQNAALFSLLGTTYGGDGRTTFGLPDLRGRVAIHTGQGPGLSNRNQGSKSGAENHTLTVSEMPQHTHGLRGSNNAATAKIPSGNVPAKTRRNAYAPGSGPLSPMASTSLGPGGTPNPITICNRFSRFVFALPYREFIPLGTKLW
jgi:microcystin-dependent protein